MFFGPDSDTDRDDAIVNIVLEPPHHSLLRISAPPVVRSLDFPGLSCLVFRHHLL